MKGWETCVCVCECVHARSHICVYIIYMESLSGFINIFLSLLFSSLCVSYSITHSHFLIKFLHLLSTSYFSLDCLSTFSILCHLLDWSERNGTDAESPRIGQHNRAPIILLGNAIMICIQYIGGINSICKNYLT